MYYAKEKCQFKRLYYFTSLKFGMSNVEKMRLKISRILELNDPFEFRSVKPPPNIGAFIKNFENWIEELNNKTGIICFSKDYSNPLMWGHYADKATGIVLGFDVEKSNLFKVNYCCDFLDPPDRLDDMEFAAKLIASKSKDWIYEAEYRIFVPLNSAQVEVQTGTDSLLFFEKFSNSMQLKEIFIGPDSPANSATVMTLKRQVGQHVSIYRTHRSTRKFKINKGPKL